MSNHPTKDCYDILGVDKEDSIDVIKKAYRKLALKWHPGIEFQSKLNKNIDNLDEATKQFQLIGRAWEILSDPQERSWYDEHRDSINGNGDTNTMGKDEFCAFMMPFFSPLAFSGYGNNDEGFYCVYSQIFVEILEKEKQSNKGIDLPVFGYCDSSADVVMQFYCVWSCFVSKRSFASADLHDVRQAPNRYVRRAMEKENSKVRDDARKQYNGTVQRLVELCKKADPRYQAALKEVEEAKRLREEENACKLLERKKAREEQMREKMNTCVTETEDCEGAFTLDDTVYEETGTANLYECVVCCKVFKKETQLLNHEQSRKHLAAVQELRAEMVMEEKQLGQYSPIEEDLQEIIEGDLRADDSYLMRNNGVTTDFDCHSEIALSPQDETLLVETPLVETPLEETPLEETPLEETPLEETPLEETPLEETAEPLACDCKKKNKRQKKHIIVEPRHEDIAVDVNANMSVLDMIEQMNSMNLRGRKAKNMDIDDNMEIPLKKGKKGKGKKK